MIPGLGMWELVAILAIILILFGAKRLPELARGIGSSIKALKDGMKEDEPGEKK